jgi:hypothetical protein
MAVLPDSIIGMRTAMLLIVLTFAYSAATSTGAAESVALRADTDRFLHPDSNGPFRAESLMPGDNESFELIPRGKEEIALKATGGRFVVTDARDRRILRLGISQAEPADAQTFRLVLAGSDRFTLRPHGTDTPAEFYAPDPRAPKPPSGPHPGETVKVYRIRPMSSIQPLLSTMVQAIAADELVGKQYDQTRTHDTNKQIELPAPTLKDPKRKRKFQVLAMTEQYRIQATLDGHPDIHIPNILYLADYANERAGAILVSADVRLPISGRVWGKIPDLASVSTGYRAEIKLSAIAEIQVRKSGGDVKIGPCKVLDLHASFSRLDLSNDLLEAARRPIKNFINRELHHNEDRLRQSANRSLEKAIASHELRIPLLGYLGLP